MPINQIKMKLIYSQLKKLLPNLDKQAKKVAADLTLIGHFSQGINQVGGGQVIDLEIAKNRGDALSYYGLARDLAVLYDIELKLSEINLPEPTKNKKPEIKISAEKDVYRLMALKIENLSNKPSPEWLKDFLNCHEINSINTLVDLTNYVMLIYGIPCHAFDAEKVSNQLEWRVGSQKDKITTLDGTRIDIPAGALVIADPAGAASLSIIGGQRTAIDLNTRETIVEMAIYDPARVRLDAKNMNIVTDASVRLEKDLDTELIPPAFNYLISLILSNCGGEIATETMDYYFKKPAPAMIKYDPEKPSAFAGIKVPEKFGLETLKKLNCEVKKTNDNYQVVPPTLRKDLNLEEDLIEEIIRFYGYDKIPTDQPISDKKLPDITPKILYLIKSVKNILVNLGYDEIRSWPIVREKHYHQPNYLPENAEPIYTENNVNSEYPLLRMSLASSLYLQIVQAKKLKLPDQQFFEAGKVYYQKENNYLENYAVGFYQPDFDRLESDAKKLVAKLGAENYQYSIEKIKNKKFIEINLDKLVEIISQVPETSLKSPNAQTGKAIELTGQIIDLDANVILDKKVSPEKLIKKYQQKISPEHLWKLEIIDIYQTKNNQYKYTFRAYYYNLSAAKAKDIHLKTFNLNHAR